MDDAEPPTRDRERRALVGPDPRPERLASSAPPAEPHSTDPLWTAAAPYAAASPSNRHPAMDSAPLAMLPATDPIVPPAPTAPPAGLPAAGEPPVNTPPGYCSAGRCAAARRCSSGRQRRPAVPPEAGPLMPGTPLRASFRRASSMAIPSGRCREHRRNTQSTRPANDRDPRLQRPWSTLPTEVDHHSDRGRSRPQRPGSIGGSQPGRPWVRAEQLKVAAGHPIAAGSDLPAVAQGAASDAGADRGRLTARCLLPNVTFIQIACAY